jgi:hypothetical protein
MTHSLAMKQTALHIAVSSKLPARGAFGNQNNCQSLLRYEPLASYANSRGYARAFVSCTACSNVESTGLE